MDAKQPEEPVAVAVGSSGSEEPKPVTESKSLEVQAPGDLVAEGKMQKTDEDVDVVQDNNEKRKVDEGREDEDGGDEKFEDAVDTTIVESVSAETISELTDDEPPLLQPADTLPLALEEEMAPLCAAVEPVTVEIEDSPEKPIAIVKPRPGPSSVKRLPITSPEIETVDLDDDDDDDDDDFEEEEDDDYYDDPESDDQEVNRVIDEAVGELNALDDPESAEDNNMDVSSDEEDPVELDSSLAR